MDPRFSPRFMAHANRLGHKARGKNSVHNLRYEPRTQLIRGIYLRVSQGLLTRIVVPVRTTGTVVFAASGGDTSGIDLF